MDDKKKNIHEVIANGDRQLIYFISILLFILFAIIIPLRHPLDSSLSEAINSVNAQIKMLDNLIYYDVKRKDTIYSETTLRNIDANLLEMEAKRTVLLKERISLIQMADKNFNIPILDISISQSTVLGTFMGFILLGLCFALHYRNKFFSLFHSLDQEDKRSVPIPIWSAPIPLTTSGIGFQKWVIKNTLGLAAHFIIMFLGLNFVVSLKKVDSETNAINIVIYVSAAILYALSIRDFLKQEWKRERI